MRKDLERRARCADPYVQRHGLSIAQRNLIPVERTMQSARGGIAVTQGIVRGCGDLFVKATEHRLRELQGGGRIAGSAPSPGAYRTSVTRASIPVSMT